MSQVEASLEHRVGYATKRLQQAVRLTAEEGLRPLGLTMPQYAVLSALADRPGLSNSELARRCFVSRQSMNEMLAGLRRAALIVRAPHPRDGRVQRTELTPLARRLAAQGDQVLAGVEARATRGLTAAQQRQLVQLLARCTDNLERQDTG